MTTMTTVTEPGLPLRSIQRHAQWYLEEGNRRRYRGALNQRRLDHDLRARLATWGVLPESVGVEFERVMTEVFGPRPVN